MNSTDKLFVNSLPNQRTTRDAKLEKKFYQATYDNIINRALSLNPKTNVTAWLNAANGIVSNDTIQYLISPLVDENTKKPVGILPGSLRETDLINTVRERNLGEYLGLPYKYEVSVHNEDVILFRNAKIKQEVDIIIQQAIINDLNALSEQRSAQSEQNGQPQEQPLNLGESKEIPNIKEHIEKVIRDYFDDRAVEGQHILELVNDINQFDTKRLQAFYYWWATEEFYTYREIINNEVKTEIISPLNGFPIINSQQFITDSEAFVKTGKITLSEIKARYWDEMDKAEQDYITSISKNKDGYFSTPATFLRLRSLLSEERSFYYQNQGREFSIANADELVDEYLVLWRTEVPITIKTFTDPLGNEMDEIVDDGYKPIDESEIVRQEWIEESWIGRRFGNATSGVYLKPKPCSVQRYDKQTNRCKLPAGGKKGILIDILQNPIPKRLITYELIDRMLGLQIERTLAKYQSHITVIPQSMMNNDTTGSTQEKMFYIKADNTLIYDDTQVELNTVISGFRVVNMSAVSDHLQVLLDLKKHYREEGLQMANMNSYRLGDVMPSTQKGVMQESIYRAAVGNVLSITMFNAALEQDHQADLEFARIAYIDGKKTSFYSNKERKVIYLDIDPLKLVDSDYGVFVHNAKLDTSKIEAYRNYAFSAAQNGEFELAAAAIEADTLPEMRKAISEIVEANKKFKVQMEQQQIDTQKYVADVAAQTTDTTNQKDIMIAKDDNDTKILVAQIQAENSTQQVSTVPSDNTNNLNTTIQNFYKTRELDVKLLMHNDKMNIENKKIASAEKIAKENKNKYDSKKNN